MTPRPVPEKPDAHQTPPPRRLTRWQQWALANQHGKSLDARRPA